MPEQNKDNNLLIVFKKLKIIGFCLFAKMSSPQGLSAIILNLQVKWSKKEYYQVLKSHLDFVMDQLRVSRLYAYIN